MKHEKGVTLIEVLATLSILMIISFLIFGVFISINKNNQNISNKNNMDQQANIIFATIRNYHLNNDTYQIKYSYRNNEYFIESPTATTIQLGNDDLIYLKINNEVLTITDNIDKVININTKDINYKSIKVTIQLKNQKGKTETVIMRY